MIRPIPLDYSASTSTSSSTIEDISTPVHGTIVKQSSDSSLLSSQTTLADKSLASDYHMRRSGSLTVDSLANGAPVTVDPDISEGDRPSKNTETSEQMLSFSAPTKSTPISIHVSSTV